MRIDLSEILEREGYNTELSVPFEAENFTFGSDELTIMEKSEVRLKLKNEGRNKASIRGTVSFAVTMNCARCLKPVVVKLELEPEAMMDFNHREEDLDEMAYVSGYNFDVDGFVLDECYVQLPMSVLCKEDCKGLCIKCGKNLNEESCDCDTFVPDPRMAKIFDIYNAFKEEV